MKKNTFPLVKHFRATTIRHAFFLNAFASAIIAALSIEMRSYLDYHDLKTNHKWNLSERQKTLIVFTTAFIVALLAYWVLHLVIGFGGGMLSN
tara:strand:+ start:1054 stop:1332 length:279 start_codon:yes stop_codon:yes gene_type:complete